MLFSDLPNLQTILSRIQGTFASARTVERRITQMTENVIAKQNSGLQEALVFSIDFDESKDVNDVVRLAVVEQYCDKYQIYKELCSMIPLPGTTKGQDFFFQFINHTF
ncbi:uncharacterized protein TNIN_393721 [Trichonephila inaurata madagascariensis]|uniref:Uncharacterized protein n=1 Tax=Trichonephila inaurata madagascariensis TaxID=2747483 RepID=A0A8X6Y4Q6_9ARAC|nr:uncharacterized protein TNIN_394431 [Trichonephila inaurata madagascariensis]GFY66026.1 uncharacterized protein TNIN_393721 [Trichonephila inaurata madagascariensis]